MRTSGFVNFGAHECVAGEGGDGGWGDPGGSRLAVFPSSRPIPQHSKTDKPRRQLHGLYYSEIVICDQHEITHYIVTI